jgi:hypothetical protein
MRAMGNVAVVADDTAERQIAARLGRADHAVVAVAASALGHPDVGCLYVITAERATSLPLANVLHSGAHICLLPPWPTHPVMFAGREVVTAPATHRERVVLCPPLHSTPAGAHDSLPEGEAPLRILYREHFVGVLGQRLAQTAAGEILLVGLPRTSNLHGHLLITTLQLGQPSTQTDKGDVGRLLRALDAWLSESGLPRVGSSLPGTTAPEPSRERDAQLALLALLVAYPAINVASDSSAADVQVSVVRVAEVFQQVAQLLGAAHGGTAFTDGWDWLTKHGIITDVVHEQISATPSSAALVTTSLVGTYLAQWQLGARLRRLNTLVTAAGARE